MCLEIGKDYPLFPSRLTTIAQVRQPGGGY